MSHTLNSYWIDTKLHWIVPHVSPTQKVDTYAYVSPTHMHLCHIHQQKSYWIETKIHGIVPHRFTNHAMYLVLGLDS